MTEVKNKSPKKRIVIISVILTVAIILGILAAVFFTSAEFALLCIAGDIKKSGVEGLRPHLTGDALRDFNAIEAIAEDELVSAMLSLFNKDDYAGTMKSHLPDIEWEILEIEKSQGKAYVTLSFNYRDQFTGDIGINVTKTDGKWMISNFDILDVGKYEIE